MKAIIFIAAKANHRAYNQQTKNCHLVAAIKPKRTKITYCKSNKTLFIEGFRVILTLGDYVDFCLMESNLYLKFRNLLFYLRPTGISRTGIELR